MNITIAVFNGFDEIDVFGPFEILSTAGFNVSLAALEPGHVVSMRGVQIRVDQELAPADGVIVPGGGWLDHAEVGAWAEARRGALPTRLIELAPQTHWMGSVCSGAMLLATAGLLRGRPATTNSACYAELAPHVGEVVDERVVDDGDRVTAGAFFAGVDLGLRIVANELGTAAVDDIVARTGYQPQGRVWESPRSKVKHFASTRRA